MVAALDLPVKKQGAMLDTYVVASHKTATLQETKDWAKFGQTETVKSNLSPDFLHVFSFDWTKGKNQVG